jgi:hypothetical protein
VLVGGGRAGSGVISMVHDDSAPEPPFAWYMMIPQVAPELPFWKQGYDIPPNMTNESENGRSSSREDDKFEFFVVIVAAAM